MVSCSRLLNKNNKNGASNESALINAVSYNFRLVVCNLDADTLYYYELDT